MNEEKTNELGKVETVGDRIKVIRMSLNMNQTEFARKLGVKQPTVSSLERGERTLSQGLLLLLVKEGFSADWIMNGGDEFDANVLLKTPQPVYVSSTSAEGKMITSIMDSIQSLDCMQLAAVKGFVEGLKQQKQLNSIVEK